VGKQFLSLVTEKKFGPETKKRPLSAFEEPQLYSLAHIETLLGNAKDRLNQRELKTNRCVAS